MVDPESCHSPLTDEGDQGLKQTGFRCDQNLNHDNMTLGRGLGLNRRPGWTLLHSKHIDMSIFETAAAVPFVAIVGLAPIVLMISVVTDARTGNATELFWRGGVRPHPRAR